MKIVKIFFLMILYKNLDNYYDKIIKKINLIFIIKLFINLNFIILF